MSEHTDLGRSGRSVVVEPRPAPTEIYDRDTMSGVIAIRIDGPDQTRGHARSFFAREWDLDFTEVKLRRTAMRMDTEYAEDVLADGGKEPYDGWPFIECKDDAPGAARYWMLDEGCYER